MQSLFSGKNSEEVQQIVALEQLLVYQVKDGWEPLCAFLGVPVPENKPFPRINETARFEKFLKIINLVVALPYVLGITFLASLALYFF